MNTDHHGLPGISEPMWTPTYCFGLWLGGLQNRLRGAVEASWVGWIPIHPATFRSHVLASAMNFSRALRAWSAAFPPRRSDPWSFPGRIRSCLRVEGQAAYMVLASAGKS